MKTTKTGEKMGVDFLGYSIFDGSETHCAEEIDKAAGSGRRECKIFLCLNPHSYIVAKDDVDFRSALKGADWLVPDGIGIVYAARWLGLPIAARVTGPDVFLAAMTLLGRRKASVFFLGASEETLNRICERAAATFPGIVVAGTYSPPFKAEFSHQDNAAMIAAVNAARPDVLWIGMTAPKQEKWLAAHRAQLNVGAAGAVGAAFDFFAGTVNRSPRVFRALGLEWLPRFLQQPRRLWRRIFISAPAFLVDVQRERRRHAITEKE